MDKTFPKFKITQRVEMFSEDSEIHNGLHFTITDLKLRTRRDGVTEWAYTGPGLDDVYVSEELLFLTNKLEGDD